MLQTWARKEDGATITSKAVDAKGIRSKLVIARYPTNILRKEDVVYYVNTLKVKGKYYDVSDNGKRNYPLNSTMKVERIPYCRQRR